MVHHMLASLRQLGHVRSTAETPGCGMMQGGSWGYASSPCNLKLPAQLGSASSCYITYRWQNKLRDVQMGTDLSLKEITSDPPGAGWGGKWDAEGNETAVAGPRPKGGLVVQPLSNLLQ